MKADLQDLFITSAKEVEVSVGRKAVIIHVPFRLLKSFHAIQQVASHHTQKQQSCLPPPSPKTAHAIPMCRQNQASLQINRMPHVQLAPPAPALPNSDASMPPKRTATSKPRMLQQPAGCA